MLRDLGGEALQVPAEQPCSPAGVCLVPSEPRPQCDCDRWGGALEEASQGLPPFSLSGLG